MIFGSGYYSPMDREYEQINLDSYPSLEEPIEAKQPLIGISEVGTTVTEGGRFGPLGQTVQSAIRLGVGRIEMATGMGGGGEPVGAESYGKEAREELRELARANEIQFTSVHAPTQVGNLSGYNPQQGGFSDEQRHMGLEEVKKAIKFAGDTAQGGAIVVHTGEFNRPITGTWDNDQYKFVGYPEEEEKAVAQLVDVRDGKVMDTIRRGQIIQRPIWLRNEKKEYVDYEGKIVDENGRVPEYDEKNRRFKVENVGWNDFENEAQKRNTQKEIELGRDLTKNEIIRPEELMFEDNIASQIHQARGMALYHGQSFGKYRKELLKLSKAKEFWEKIEQETDESERDRLKQQFSREQHYLIPEDEKEFPTEYLNKAIEDAKKQIEYMQDTATTYEQQSIELESRKKHIVPVEKFAINKSLTSYAEAGIYAMKETEDNPHVQRDLFVAPENIFPEMGYGSHPEELIELVQGARKKMVQHLTNRFVADSAGHILTKNEADEWNKQNPDMTRIEGDVAYVNNPNYNGALSNQEAEELAGRHIKATFDTQHLGMWWKHFVAEPGESEEERRTRFNGWYMDEVKKMEKSGIIGHIHIVDAMGGGHHHLPAGQGDLPVVDAVEYLKKKGYAGTMVSEAHEENMKYGAARQLEATWKAFGSPVYGMGTGRPGSPTRFADVHQSYFGLTAPPNYVFGSYSPSNDWTLWTQVPLE